VKRIDAEILRLQELRKQRIEQLLHK